MRSYQKNSVLLLIGIIVIVSASLVYLFTAGKTSTQQHAVERPTVARHTPLAELSQSHPVKPCSSKQRDFQMGVAFPDWGATAYGASDTKWLTELPHMQKETAACWVEMPVLFHQSSLTSTTVMQGPPTSQLSPFNDGVQFAHALRLQVLLPLQLQAAGPQPWSADISFSTYAQEQQLFDSYWQAINPYAVAAS